MDAVVNYSQSTNVTQKVVRRAKKLIRKVEKVKKLDRRKIKRVGKNLYDAQKASMKDVVVLKSLSLSETQVKEKMQELAEESELLMNIKCIASDEGERYIVEGEVDIEAAKCLGYKEVYVDEVQIPYKKYTTLEKLKKDFE